MLDNVGMLRSHPVDEGWMRRRGELSESVLLLLRARDEITAHEAAAQQRERAEGGGGPEGQEWAATADDPARLARQSRDDDEFNSHPRRDRGTAHRLNSNNVSALFDSSHPFRYNSSHHTHHSSPIMAARKVKDTELYDVLGVQPTATDIEYALLFSPHSPPSWHLTDPQAEKGVPKARNQGGRRRAR